MVAVYILAVVLIIIAIILIIRVGATLIYGEDGLELAAFVGPVRIKITPKEEKKEKEKKSEKKKKTKKEKEEQVKKLDVGGKVSAIKSILPAVFDALGKLRHKLSVDELIVHYTVASDDPAESAILFGRVSAAIGAATPIIENAFKIKNRDIGVNVDFSLKDPIIYIRARFSLAIWEVLYIIYGPGKEFIKLLLAADKKKQKRDKDQTDETINAGDTGDGKVEL